MATLTFYRLIKSDYAANVFDGFGARTYGGRWNSIGISCVYLGTSKALCVLESLVHLNIADLSNNYSMMALEIPERYVLELDKKSLPADWRDDPAPTSTKMIGDGWLSNMDNGMVLKLPSTITGEWNALFNPHHPATPAALKTINIEPFLFDSRIILK